MAAIAERQRSPNRPIEDDLDTGRGRTPVGGPSVCGFPEASGRHRRGARADCPAGPYCMWLRQRSEIELTGNVSMHRIRSPRSVSGAAPVRLDVSCHRPPPSCRAEERAGDSVPHPIWQQLPLSPAADPKRTRLNHDWKQGIRQATLGEQQDMVDIAVSVGVLGQPIAVRVQRRGAMKRDRQRPQPVLHAPFVERSPCRFPDAQRRGDVRQVCSGKRPAEGLRSVGAGRSDGTLSDLFSLLQHRSHM